MIKNIFTLLFIIVMIVSLVMGPTANSVNALSLRSVSFKKFIQMTELAAWATVVKGERINGVKTTTLRITSTIFGPRNVKQVQLSSRGRLVGYPTELGVQAFLALRKNSQGKWETVMHRGFWKLEHYIKQSGGILYALKIPDSLIRGIPRLWKKTAKCKIWVPNGTYHNFTIKYFPYFGIHKKLLTAFNSRREP